MNSECKFYFSVGQLIEVLQTFPPDLPVLVSGQKSGFENFYHPFVDNLKHVPENTFERGEFQYPEKKDKEIFQAVILKMVDRDD